MLYHKLHWGAARGAEFLLGGGGTPQFYPFEPPLTSGQNQDSGGYRLRLHTPDYRLRGISGGDEHSVA